MICGIDPGTKGGIAMLSARGEPHMAVPIPYLNKALDVVALSSILNLYQPSLVVVEQQSIMARQSGAMSIGSNYGRILAALELGSYSHKIVTPSVWNKRAGVPTGLKGKDKKAESYRIAKRLWGKSFDDLNLRSTQDGPIEALLIAYYGGAT